MSKERRRGEKREERSAEIKETKQEDAVQTRETRADGGRREEGAERRTRSVAECCHRSSDRRAALSASSLSRAADVAGRSSAEATVSDPLRREWPCPSFPSG